MMNNINYKVIFKGLNERNNLDLILTFRKINSIKKITVPHYVVSELKNIQKKNSIIHIFENIDNVFAIGSDTQALNYLDYYVVLYTLKKGRKKEGFLIAGEKKEGDLDILGIWPFNIYESEFSKEEILDIFNQLINNPDNYNNICLITS